MGQGSSGSQLEDRYYLQKVKLGQGSFGTVWRAVDRQNGNVVAIKQVDKSMLPRRGVRREDIEREVSMMKACPHNNITMIYDTFEDTGNIYLALEYCDGGDFGDKVKERGMGLLEQECADWMWQICSAIAALHGKCICHRDIKLDNFMVSHLKGQGRITLKLTDFGLAISLPHGQVLTEKCGTPAFMSPELYNLPKRSRGYSFGVDLWAAGICMYMMMFGGRHPFLNDRGSLNEKSLHAGELDFGHGAGSGFFGFALGSVQLRYSDNARQFCSRLIVVDPQRRLRANDSLASPWFSSCGIRGSPPIQPPATGPFPGIPGQATAVQPTLSSQVHPASNLSARGLPPGPTSMPFPKPAAPPSSAEMHSLRHENQYLRAQLVEQQHKNHYVNHQSPQQYNQFAQQQQQQMQQMHMRNSQRPSSQKNLDQQPALERFHTTLDSGNVCHTTSNDGNLTEGLKCLYFSEKYGWLPGVVEKFNQSDKTYNLDVRMHAALLRIAPARDTYSSDAWPPGTCVSYQSKTTKSWMPGWIVSFNDGDKTYNLDVREHADPDRIRARVSDRMQSNGTNSNHFPIQWQSGNNSAYRTEKPVDRRDGSAAYPLRVQDLDPGASRPSSLVAPAGFDEGYRPMSDQWCVRI